MKELKQLKDLFSIIEDKFAKETNNSVLKTSFSNSEVVNDKRNQNKSPNMPFKPVRQKKLKKKTSYGKKQQSDGK